MELLFSKNDNEFSEELRDCLGFVDADIRFKKLKPDLRSATLEMIKLIGSTMYDEVVTAYNAETNESRSELVSVVRYPLALNAYRLYAPSNDLKHSENGRVTRVDDNEKQPFPWMLDRDNKNRELKYYRSLDDMLQYLDISGGATWLESEARKKLSQFFVNSTSDFEDFFPIESRLLLIKLMPGIRKAERDYIKPTIGEARFDQLKQEAANGDSVTDKILFALVKEAIVFYALSWGMTRLTVSLFPEGVLQQYVSDRMSAKPSKTPEFLQSQLAHQEFAKDADKVLLDIQKHLRKQEVDSQEEKDIEYNLDFNDEDLFVNT